MAAIAHSCFTLVLFPNKLAQDYQMLASLSVSAHTLAAEILLVLSVLLFMALWQIVCDSTVFVCTTTYSVHCIVDLLSIGPL